MTEKKSLYVGIGKAIWSKSPEILYCKGLGSCVAICLYDEQIKKGCIVHILLPFGEDEKKCFFFANLAIPRAIEESVKRGMRRNRIWAKIIGGSCVFSEVDEKNSIGQRNVFEVKKWLKFYKIPIISEDVGGRCGRNLTFFLDDGRVEIFTLKKGVIII